MLANSDSKGLWLLVSANIINIGIMYIVLTAAKTKVKICTPEWKNDFFIVPLYSHKSDYHKYLQTV